MNYCVCFVYKICRTSWKNALVSQCTYKRPMYSTYLLLYFFQSDYFTGKNILQREKEHCAIFIRAHFMWGLWYG